MEKECKYSLWLCKLHQFLVFSGSKFIQYNDDRKGKYKILICILAQNRKKGVKKVAMWYDELYPKDQWKAADYRIMDLYGLKGKKGLITGACGGLGRNVAAAWAEMGADVAMADLERTKDKLVPLCEELSERYGIKAVPIYCDVSDPEAVGEMKKTVLEELGDLDLAFINAGVCLGGDDVNVPYEVWKKTIDIDLNGIFLCAMAAKEIMLEKGHGGSMVLTSSLSGFWANNGGGYPTPVCSYGSAKAGVAQLARFMAGSLAKDGIRVNAVAPGYIWSGIHEGVMEKEGHDWLLEPVPIKHFGLTEDIASAVLFLTSNAGKYITGTTLHVDGGYSVF